MRCRTAAIGQVGVTASGTKSLPADWIWSPWLIQTVVSRGTSWKRGSAGVEHAAFHAAEFAARRVGLDRDAHRLADQLHAVADAQDRHAQLEDRRIAVRSAGLVNAGRAAGEDDRQRIELADSFRGDVVADDPREGMMLANPARDELDVLGAEIEDEDGSFCRIGIRHERIFERGAIRAGSDWLPRCVPSVTALGVLENGSGASTSDCGSVRVFELPRRGPGR